MMVLRLLCIGALLKDRSAMAQEGLWEQLEKLDGQAGQSPAPVQARLRRVQRAKCQYLSDVERYVIVLLNTEYVVYLSKREIFLHRPPSEQKPAGFLEQLCILTYLINAQDIPLANKLVGAEALPGGQFFFQGVHRLPTRKLEEAFGDCPENLYLLSTQLNAKRREFGDASIELDVLPRIPLTIVIWRRDEEFAARASILFDQTAGAHLPLDALLAGVNLTVDALVGAARKSG